MTTRICPASKRARSPDTSTPPSGDRRSNKKRATTATSSRRQARCHLAGGCRRPILKHYRKVPPITINKKNRIHQLIIEQLTTDLAVFSVAARTAHEASIHEENLPDNKYDTLSLEASYLAQGQANRAQEIMRALHAYRTLAPQHFEAVAPIRLTALVTLEAEDGKSRTLFIGPQEGGVKLVLNGEEILIITPGSPLGNDLIGKCVGDLVTIGRNRLKRDFEIVRVC